MWKVLDKKPIWVGPLLTLVAAAALQLYDTWDAGAHLASVLVLSVVLSAFLGGRLSGLLSAGIAVAYALLDWDVFDSWDRGSTPDHARLIVLAVATPIMAVVVGYLREHADAAVLALRDDIEQRKRAEAALLKVNKQLDSVMNFSLDLICTNDAKGRFLLASASSETILGYTPDEMLEFDYQHLLHPDDRESAASANLQVMAAGELPAYECRFIHKDGRAVSLTWTSRWDAATGAVYSVGRDVTRLREAEARELRDRKTIATLQGLLHVCAWCNKIQNEDAAWEKLDMYVERHSDAQVTHAMCPACLESRYPEA